MTALELLKTIRAAVTDANAKGASALAVVPLDQYLASLEPLVMQSQPPPSADHQLQAAIAQYQGNVQHQVEMFRSVIESGRTARQAGVLICGRAAVALLAFVGHVVTDAGKHAWLVGALAFPLGAYVLGALFSAIASGTTYAAQSAWGEAQRQTTQDAAKAFDRNARWWNVWSIRLVLGTYSLFFVGSMVAFAIFLTFARLDVGTTACVPTATSPCPSAIPSTTARPSSR